MYNLVEYSKSYRKTTGSLWNYYRDEPNNPPLNLFVHNHHHTVNYKDDSITNSASFKYKSSIIGKTPENDNNDNYTKDVEVSVPIKYIYNFRYVIN